MSAEEPWYVTAFRGGYREVYPHRDLAAARREAAWLVDRGVRGRVLDLCCGFGRHSLALTELGCDVFGLDRSIELLRQAHADPAIRAVAPRLVQGDARVLPFADASFDVVLSIRFLFHVPRELRPAILAEMARVARRAVVVDVRHKYALGAWTRPLRARFTGKRVPYRASLAELEADFAAAGLVIARRAWIAPFFSEKLVVAAVKR